MYLFVCVCIPCLRVPAEARRGHWFPGAVITDGHNPPDVDTENRTWVFLENSKNSKWKNCVLVLIKLVFKSYLYCLGI